MAAAVMAVVDFKTEGLTDLENVATVIAGEGIACGAVRCGSLKSGHADTVGTCV